MIKKSFLAFNGKLGALCALGASFLGSTSLYGLDSYQDKDCFALDLESSDRVWVLPCDDHESVMGMRQDCLTTGNFQLQGRPITWFTAQIDEASASKLESKQPTAILGALVSRFQSRFESLKLALDSIEAHLFDEETDLSLDCSLKQRNSSSLFSLSGFVINKNSGEKTAVSIAFSLNPVPKLDSDIEPIRNFNVTGLICFNEGMVDQLTAMLPLKEASEANEQVARAKLLDLDEQVQSEEDLVVDEVVEEGDDELLGDS